MSEDHDATTIHASRGGGGSKWLLGAAAAVVLLGGGYMAWDAYGPRGEATQGEVETAYNDPYAAEEPLRASPLDTEEPLAENAGADDAIAPPAPAQPRAAAPARRQAAQAPAVPEETIGITPINASMQDGDDIVVTARRPIWAETPNQRRLSALYPARLLERGREGEAQLQCTVLAGGALDCVSVEETPGFGNAALRVARTLRHAPQLADGADAAGTPVNLRVIFRIEEEQPRQRFASR